MLASTETVIDYEDQGIGVYRIPITPDADYDSFCVRVSRGLYPGFTPAVMEDFLTLGKP